jgi:parallel beta-helix repeat protein
MKRLILGFMLAGVLTRGIASAETHYVSKTGSNEYPYNSWATAADSIQKGINAASYGDTVRVGAGTYRETIRMTAGITLIGSGMDFCIIYPQSRSVRDIVYGADSAVIEGFYIRGWQPGNEEFCVGIRSAVDSKLRKVTNNNITNCDLGVYMGIVNTEVTNNVLTDNWIAIDANLASMSLIINNTITHNNKGIKLWDAASSRVVKNIITDVDMRAIDGNFLDSVFIENNMIIPTVSFITVFLEKLSEGFVTAPIRNNTISSDKWHAVISVSFTNEIKNNILMDGYSAVDAYRYNGYSCNPQVSYNDLWNNVQSFTTANGATIDTSLGGNIYLDPMFVGDEDYHLQYGSPCIDAGDPNIKDIDSSRSDMGCYGGTWGETYTYQDYPPKAPDSLKAVSESTVIVVSWKPNTESDLSHYFVYKDVTSGFVPNIYNLVASIVKDSSVFRDHDFVLGETYYYRISAWDTMGHRSEYSDELKVEATSVGEYVEEDNRPPMYQLSQNYPNPFNSETVIWYYLPDVGYQPAEVEITIYNLLGKLVRTLVETRQYPGEHKVTWDGKDDLGKEVASGIYFYRLKVSGLELVKPKKMVLLR